MDFDPFDPIHKLRLEAEGAVDHLRHIEPASDGATNRARKTLEKLLAFAGGKICDSGKLDRVALLAVWAQVMLDANPDIEVGAFPTPAGYMLTAQLTDDRTYIPDAFVRQLFLWGDLRSNRDVVTLCENRAVELIADAIEGGHE